MGSCIEELFCRNEQRLIQRKNTGLITDLLGPFPDEPLLHAVDKTLFFTCDLYATYYAPDPAALYNAGFLTDTGSMSKCSSKVNLSRCSSKVSIAQLAQNKQLSSMFLNKSFSTTDLSQLSKLSDLSKLSQKFSDSCPKPKCKKKIKPCQVCGKGKERQWVKTKSTPQGVKCYEVWSDDVCQKCPSIVFIVPPSGDSISFASVPN